MRLAARVDENQPSIVRSLRQAGYSVCVLSSVGKGVPDLLIGAHGYNILLEVKNGDKPPSARRLTADEARWHTAWKGQVVTICSVDEAIEAIEQVIKVKA